MARRGLSIGCLAFGAASRPAPWLRPRHGWSVPGSCKALPLLLFAPASLALIGATYPRTERTRAIGVWAAASALTTAGGPVLGGWLTEMYGWQLVFWMDPPLALVAVALLTAFAPPDHREARQFDPVGGCHAGHRAWSVGVGAQSDWARRNSPASAGSLSGPASTIVAALGIVGLGAYAFWERSSPHPMTPPRLARNRPFVGLNVATVLLDGAASIMFFLLPFELVDRRGLQATDAGLVFLPFTLAVGVLSRLFGSLADLIGARTPNLVWGSASRRYLLLDAAGRGSRPRQARPSRYP